MRIKITNIVMDNTPKIFTADEDTKSIAFQASGGDISLLTPESQDVWTLKADRPEAIDTRNVGGMTFTFNAASGTVQIRELIGQLN